MKKVKILLAVLLCTALGLFGLTACGEPDTSVKKIEVDGAGTASYVDGELILPELIVTARDGSVSRVKVTRQMISDEDFAKLNTEGTHEITINYAGASTGLTLTITGEKGDKGDPGLGIKDVTINSEGKLVITYSNDTTKVVGTVVGQNGQTGPAGQPGAQGPAGADGRGIADLEIRDGNLWVTYTGSDTAVDLGSVKGDKGDKGDTGAAGAQGPAGADGQDGQNGQDGRGIKSIVMNEDGSITVTYTDDTTTELTNNLTGYTVTFLADDTILSKQCVKAGFSAVAPEVPVKTGYRFTGWDKAFDNITGNLTVNATFALKTVDTDWYTPAGRIFELSTAQQLAGLAEIVNSGVDSFKGKVVKLANSIDLSGVESWTPIGKRIVINGKDEFGNEMTGDFPNVSNAFEGTFDGQGYSVMNWTADNLKWAGEYDNTAALFGVVSGAIIKNLTIDGFVLRGDKSMAGVASWVYGAATFNNITVRNSQFNNTWLNYGIGAIFARSHNYNDYDGCKQDAVITLQNCVVDNVILDCGGVFKNGEGLADECEDGLYKGANVGSLWGSITLAKDGDSNGRGMNTHIRVINCSSSAVIKDGNTNNGEIGGYGNCRSITVDGWTFTGKLLGYDKEDGTDGDPIPSNIIGYSGECYLYVSDTSAFNKAAASPRVSNIYLTKDIDGAVINRVKGDSGLAIYLQGHTLTLAQTANVGAGASLSVLNVNPKLSEPLANKGVVTRPATGSGNDKNTIFNVQGTLVTTDIDIRMDAFDDSADGSSYGVRVSGAGSRYTMNGGSNTAVYGVTVSGKAAFTMNGGLIESKYICVSSNGYYVNSGYTVTINKESVLKSPDTIIYMPSEGRVTIGGAEGAPVVMENTTAYAGTGSPTYGIVVRAGVLTLNDYVNLKVNAAINPNGDITSGGSGSVAGAIVIGKPAGATVKAPDGVYEESDGYVGDVRVIIRGAHTTIENVNAEGYAIYKGEKSVTDKGYAFSCTVANEVTVTGVVADDSAA